MSVIGRRTFLRNLIGRPHTAENECRAEQDKHASCTVEAETSSVRALSEAYGMAVQAAFGEDADETEYEALLPPDFTPELLQLEAQRLGLSPDLHRRELAREVLRKMGSLPT